MVGIIKSLLLLLLLVVPSQAIAYMPNVVFSHGAAAPVIPPIVLQTFDGIGYSGGETWVENVGTGGVVDEDYTTKIISGTHSLFLMESSGDVSTYNTFGLLYADINLRTKFQVSVAPSTNTSTRFFAGFNSTTDTSLCAALFDWTSPNLYINARIGSTNGISAVTAFAVGDTLSVWLEYSNTNDTCTVYWSQTGVKPVYPSNNATQATGSITTDAARLRLISDYPNAELIFDDVKVSAVPIGDF